MVNVEAGGNVDTGVTLGTGVGTGVGLGSAALVPARRPNVLGKKAMREPVAPSTGLPLYI